MNVWFGKCQKMLEHGIYREQYIILEAPKFWTKLSSSFLTGVLYYCFKLIYAYLNEGHQFCECYSCLKMVILAHLHVGFLQCFSLNVHYLSDSNYLWNCCNQGQLLNKKVIMKCLAIKFFAWNFLQLQIQKI